MKSKWQCTFVRLFGITVIVAVIIFSIAACDNGGGGGGSPKIDPPPPNTDPKTLVITGITDLNEYGQVAIFEKGTTPEQMVEGIGLVAGAISSNSDYTASGTTASGATLNIALYNPGTNNGRWTGNGTYDIGIMLKIGSDTEGSGYGTTNIAFSSATTTVAWSKFTKYGE
jgi:hypothetical protein